MGLQHVVWFLGRLVDEHPVALCSSISTGVLVSFVMITRSHSVRGHECGKRKIMKRDEGPSDAPFSLPETYVPGRTMQ